MSNYHVLLNFSRKVEKSFLFIILLYFLLFVRKGFLILVYIIYLTLDCFILFYCFLWQNILWFEGYRIEDVEIMDVLELIELFIIYRDLKTQNLQELSYISYIFTKLLPNKLCLINTHMIYQHARCYCRL